MPLQWQFPGLQSTLLRVHPDHSKIKIKSNIAIWINVRLIYRNLINCIEISRTLTILGLCWPRRAIKKLVYSMMNKSGKIWQTFFYNINEQGVRLVLSHKPARNSDSAPQRINRKDLRPPLCPPIIDSYSRTIINNKNQNLSKISSRIFITEHY